MRIAILGNKGGGGKTTLAVHLFYAISEVEECVLIDADYSQKSAYNWVKAKEYKKGKIYTGDSLEQILGYVEEVKAKNIIIDGRPEIRVTGEIIRRLNSEKDVMITSILIDREHIEQLRELHKVINEKGYKIRKYVIVNEMTQARISQKLLELCHQYNFGILALLPFTEYMKIARNMNKPVWEVTGRVKHGDIYRSIAFWVMEEKL